MKYGNLKYTKAIALMVVTGLSLSACDDFLDRLSKTIEDGLKGISGEEHTITSISLAKLKEMKAKLASGYTSFWS